MVDMRPSWDEYFMSLAFDASSRSTCLRRHVGAVIVKNKQLLTIGYNGAPSGVTHCDEVGCMREQLHVPSGQRHELCRALHAEQNALLQAASHGIDVSDSVIYVTDQPCSVCTKMIINVGIKKIVWSRPYDDKLATELLAETEVISTQVQANETVNHIR